MDRSWVARFVAAAGLATALSTATSHAVAEVQRTGTPLEGERNSRVPAYRLAAARSAAAPTRSATSLQRVPKLLDRIGLTSSVGSPSTDSTKQKVARSVAARHSESSDQRDKLASNGSGPQSAQTAPPKQQRTRTITNRNPAEE